MEVLTGGMENNVRVSGADQADPQTDKPSETLRRARYLNHAGVSQPSGAVVRAVTDHLTRGGIEGGAILGLPSTLAHTLHLRDSFVFRPNATQALRDSIETVLFHRVDLRSHVSYAGEGGADLARLLRTPGYGAAAGTLLRTDIEHPAVERVLRTIWPSAMLPNPVRIADIMLVDNFPNARETLRNRFREGILEFQPSIVVLPHVIWANGGVLDVKDLCRLIKELRPLAVTVVDGAQAAGQIPLAVESYSQENSDIDFYVACGHKWLGGPETLGFVRVSSRIVNSCPRCTDFLMSGDSITDSSGVAFHYRGAQIGTQQRGVAAGMSVALEELVAGRSDIEARHSRIRNAADHLRVSLADIRSISALGPPAQMRSGVVAFTVEGDRGELSMAIQSRLYEHGFECARYRLDTSDPVFGGQWFLRASPGPNFPVEETALFARLIREVLDETRPSP